MPEAPDAKAKPHPFRMPPAEGPRRSAPDAAYAELEVTSNFTFLTGASHPDELVAHAAALGHRAVAITDTNTLAGIVRAHVAAKETGIQLVVGCRLVFESPVFAGRGLEVLVYPMDRPAYAGLCRLLTLGKRRAEKGECRLGLADLLEHHRGLLAVAVPPASIGEEFVSVLRELRGVFDDDRLSLAALREHGPDDRTRLERLAALSMETGVPPVAVNQVHYHIPERRPLQDVVTCIRLGCTIGEAGKNLLPHGEFHLKPPDEMARLFAGHGAAVARTIEIAQRAAGFSLDQIRYEYPEETCPPGRTPQEHLGDLTWEGAAKRYPGGIPEKVRALIEHELVLIGELNYARYFLTVHDLVTYARSIHILCQGRGAAANSAVCYSLGVTSVDPSQIDLLFERFVSRERNEPPDIDIDFEHERREDVIQYIYRKYGRQRAALTAEVISYRGRSAVRDVGKAMGLSLDCVDTLAKSQDWWDSGGVKDERLRELGMNPEDQTLQQALFLSREILGFPRHLSQHVGGFVITRTPLNELVPIENAAMEDRTVIEWDKDDIDALGMLKVDVLGLGMLTAIRRAFEFVNEGEGKGQRDKGTEGQSESKEELLEEVGRGVLGSNVTFEDHDDPSQEPLDEHDTDLSGSHCVEAGQGTEQSDLSRHDEDAQVGAVRVDQPDASRFGLDCVEYRRGIRATDARRVFAGTEHRLRFTGGVEHAVGDRNGTQFDPGQRNDRRSHPGGRPTSPIVDHQTEGQGRLGHQGDLTSSLCPSVPLSLAPLLELHTVPQDVEAVYDAICHADTIGVFQIESRAQMSMLPRLKPRTFYDLVIEVAIVRPGPIQGNMVHPYLRRRNKEESFTYPNEEVKAVLAKTLGVPLFQEQAMALAMVAAGFTADEADQLRRAMAAWKRKGHLIYRFGQRLIDGMLERGYPREFAERCFEQIKGFSEYGFPESHAASFAHLVYVSAWLKVHHPAAFAAAIINSQPMGFYAPAQIVRDAKEHGVEVRGVDVGWSGWDCRLERGESGRVAEWQRDKAIRAEEPGRGTTTSDYTRAAHECETHFATLPLCHSATPLPPALRLGMRLVKGLGKDEATKIEETVGRYGAFSTVEELWRASRVRVASMRALASADAFGSMGLDRQQALWQVRALKDEELPLWHGPPGHVRDGEAHREQAPLPPIPAPLKVAHDYEAVGLSLKAHPMSFIRAELDRRGVVRAGELRDETAFPMGREAAVAGVVLVRQRPGTASGIVFFTIEDETGIANLIVRPHIYDRCRRAARHSVGILARGKVERQGEVVHILVRSIVSVDDLLQGLTASSRDFH
jgi:error-prone DNA polymerase